MRPRTRQAPFFLPPELGQPACLLGGPVRRILRHMAVRRAAVPPLLACVAALLVACSSDQAASTLEGASQSTSQPPGSSPRPVTSSTRYTDCDALAPGDAITFPDLTCDPDDARQLQTMDCKSGVYVRLTGAPSDLEGIAGSTPTWRAAEPIDPRYGRTTWAFNNCLEHG